MANKLFQQLGGQRPQNNIVGMFNALKGAQNPQQMLMNMMQNNPQMQSIMRDVQANGGDARALFYQRAQQMGIDPETILSQLK